MPRTLDTTLRYLATLATLPRHPRAVTAREIQRKLRDMDRQYDVDIRSTQRTLEQLSRMFPITSIKRGQVNHWSWSDRNSLFQIPAMSQPTAFALRLAQDYLRPIMPPEALRMLEPYFRYARRILENTGLGGWRNRAAIIATGPRLKPPDVAEDVREAVYGALIGRRQIKVRYRGKHESESMQMILHPLGIVVRAGITYLMATAWGFDDVRHYVLHRMSGAEALDDEEAREPPDFRLAEHLSDAGSFAYPEGDERIALRALFDEGAGAHLTESSLAPDHRATAREDGRILVEATVADTAELRWWLAGFGSQVEVLAPDSLRREFRDDALRLAQRYAQDERAG